MRPFAFVVAAGFLTASAPSTAASATAEDDYRHGRVRFVESGVTLHRATEVSAEEALANLPFLPGDRVWSDGDGRAEFQFPDGTLVRLDSRSKLDYAGHEEGRDERIVLRLWSGSLIVRVRTRDAARFEIETPAGTVELLDQAMVRVDVESGEARVSAYRGGAVLDDGRGRVQLAAGERTFARWGEAAEAPQPFEIGQEDDFARWDDTRESEERWAARSSEYLPAELDPYAGELERNGSWRFEASVGYVWAPRVAAGWSPYANGHWSWTPYGWTWVPYETWGWAPFHYGRWGFSVAFGWYWAPGRVWGPGWVSWGVGGGYVGWCPLGYRDRPVYPWGGHNRGYAVPRHGGHGGWNVVREGDFGHRDVARRRMPLAGIDPGALRVADSPHLRPTRDRRALLASNPTPRAISRRPTPGDFVRELAVDNKTTIPSPWLRRGRATGSDAAKRETRERVTAARPSGSIDHGAAARSGSGARAAGGSQERPASRPRASRSVPWYAPRDGTGTSRTGATRSQAREPRPRDTQALRRDEPTRSYGRRDEATRSSGGRDESRSYTPRAERPQSSLPEGSGGQPSQRSLRQRQDADRGDSLGGQARYRSSPQRRDDSSGSRPQTQRADRPARDDSRSEPRTPRAESGSRPSRSDASARSGGGQPSGGGQRSAPRPPRERR
jgi:hypothetical protein